MKLQELMENQGQVKRFNSFEEFEQFIDSQENPPKYYAFWEAEGQDAHYSGIIEITNFVNRPGDRSTWDSDYDYEGTQEVEWQVVMYGPGEDSNEHWVKEGSVELTRNGWDSVNEGLFDKVKEDIEADRY